MSTIAVLLIQVGCFMASHQLLLPVFTKKQSPITPLITTIFNLTFTCSLSLLCLLACELLNLLSQQSRLLFWKLNLWCLLIMLSVVIPVSLLHSALPRRPRSLLLAIIVYCFLFYRLGSFFSSTNLLPALMSRVGLVGVLLMGIISGYGSVQNPVQLFWLRSNKRVEEDTLMTYADRCTQATQQLETKRAALRQHQIQDDSSMGWLMKRVTAVISQQGSLAEEVADLELAVDSMQSEYSSLKSLQEKQEFDRTALGRCYNSLNYLLAVYSVYRIFSAWLNVLLGRIGEADPVSIVLGLFVHLFASADWDVRLWSREISFLFVGGVIVSSGRAFFLELSRLMKVSNTGNSVLLLFISLLAGLYVSSSILMLRLNLPPAARPLITQVLEGIQFSWFDKCFDLIYLASALLTLIYMKLSE